MPALARAHRNLTHTFLTIAEAGPQGLGDWDVPNLRHAQLLKGHGLVGRPDVTGRWSLTRAGQKYYTSLKAKASN